MNYNLNDIKAEITNNVKDSFDSSTRPTYSDFSSEFNFDDALDLFFKTVIYKCGVTELDGLTKTIIPTLHESYFSKRGEIAPVRTLATELEAYLKKIAYLISNGTNNFANDRSKTLIPLYNHLQLHSTALVSTALCDTNLPNFRGKDDFIEFLCKSYIIRNAVHKSPNWKFSEIAINLESIVITFLYPTFKYYKQLFPIVNTIVLPVIPDTKTKVSFDISNKQALYDFISYNHGASQIRNQIVTSYILHVLSNNGESISISHIQKACNDHFTTNADLSFYRSIVKELAKPGIDKVTIGGLLDDLISLTDAERARIIKLREDFYFQEQMFQIEISEVLKIYSIEDKTEEVIRLLINLFESNYNIDVKEILDEGPTANDNIQNLKVCIDHLKVIVPKGKSVDTLLKDLINVCKGNDFINKVTAGQVFAKVSNLPNIQEYFSQGRRIIYLDTNVLLHVMCYYYEDDNEYSSIYYQSTRDLLKYTDDHTNIVLKTTNLYVQEVAYHFKEALLLIPFEELGLFQRTGGSNNVFYKFYVGLKNNNNLDDDVETFADFMRGFEMSEDNISDRQFFQNTSQLIAEFLNELGIDVIELPYYVKDDVLEVVKNSLTMNNKFKDIVPMTNDTLMVCHLGDKNYHENDPTFITWDTSFFDIRKKYVTKFKNANMWHLFTPNKLLTHSQLLEFKIDSSNVTNDFLTIIDTINLPERTRNVLDTVSQLLNIEKEERRRYVTKFKEFSAKYVFNLDDNSAIEAEESKLTLNPIEKVISELFRYYNDKRRRYNFEDLKSLFTNRTHFDNVVSIIQTALESYVKDKIVTDQTFTDFDGLIDKSKKTD